MDNAIGRGVAERATSAALAWRDKATICEFLAFTLRYPDAAFEEAVRSGEWTQTALEVASVLSGDAGVSRLKKALGEGEGQTFSDEALKHLDDCADALKAEATRLFIGAPTPVVQPYEGTFRIAAQGVGKPLMFVNMFCREVTAFFECCGIGSPEGVNEPLDHIATELTLLQYLASLEAGITRPLGNVEPDQLPGGSAAAAYIEFFDAHIASWAGDFSDALMVATDCAVYRAAAVLLKELVEVGMN